MKRIILFTLLLFTATFSNAQRYTLNQIKASWSTRQVPLGTPNTATWNTLYNGSNGTNNFLTKWSSDTLVNSLIFDNGTNLGIGTTTPTSKLHLKGSFNVNPTAGVDFLINNSGLTLTSTGFDATVGSGTFSTTSMTTTGLWEFNGLGNTSGSNALTVQNSDGDYILKVRNDKRLIYTDGNQTNGDVLTCDANGVATWQPASGGGTPGGSDTQLQYNNAGSFGGISGATTNGTNVTFGSGNLIAVAPVLGTPTSITLTNATGLPVSTGISGLGTGIATFLGTPSSSNFATAITDETGTGLVVLNTSPTFTTQIASPKILGGTGTTSSLTYQTTSGVGTTGADHIWKIGNNGATEAMRVNNAGQFLVGASSAIGGGDIFNFTKDGNANATGRVVNNTSGTAAYSGIQAYSVSGVLDMNFFSALYTSSGVNQASTGVINASASGGLNLSAAAGSLRLWTNGTQRLAITTAGVATWSSAYHVLAPGTATAGTAPIKLTTGTSLTSADPGAIEYTTPQLFFTNGAGVRQEIPQIQQSRVSSQFDATTTTLANITGLTSNVAAGKTYRFEAILYVDADLTGGTKYAIAGTATATNIIYEVSEISNTFSTSPNNSRQTALGGASGQVSGDAGLYCRITGTITVNAAGTLTCQFAQNSANGTSSVLVGSTFVITEML